MLNSLGVMTMDKAVSKKLKKLETKNTNKFSFVVIMDEFWEYVWEANRNRSFP